MGMLERLSDVRGTIEGKIVAVVLAILLVLPMASISAFASHEEASDAPQDAVETVASLEDTTSGDTTVLNEVVVETPEQPTPEAPQPENTPAPEFATIDEFNEACAAMGDADDEASILAVLDNIASVYNRLSDADKAAVADQWAYVQSYAASVKGGNPDEGIQTMAEFTSGVTKSAFENAYNLGQNDTCYGIVKLNGEIETDSGTPQIWATGGWSGSTPATGYNRTDPISYDPDIVTVTTKTEGGKLSIVFTPGTKAGTTKVSVGADAKYYNEAFGGTLNMNLNFDYTVTNNGNGSGNEATTPEANKPAPPDSSAIKKFTNSTYGAVRIHCTAKNAHYGKVSNLANYPEGYVLGEVVANDGSRISASSYPWQCTLTLKNSYWVDLFNQNYASKWGRHYLASKTGTVSANFYSNGTNWYFVTDDVPLYVYVAEKAVSASYTVVHEYYTNGEKTGESKDTNVQGTLGAPIKASDITKKTTYDGNTYEYASASPESLELTATAANNVITLRYDRTGESYDYRLRYHDRAGTDTSTDAVSKMPDPNPTAWETDTAREHTLKVSSTKPTRAGYTFKGWRAPYVSLSKIFQPGEDITVWLEDDDVLTTLEVDLYAVWEEGEDTETTYRIDRVYWINGDNVASVTGGEGAGTLVKGEVGDEIVGADLDAANTGWRTKKYEGEKRTFDYAGSDPEILTLKADSENVITLKYEINDVVEKTYTVVYKDGANGDAFGDESHGNLKEGDSTPAFEGITARTGYTFLGWTPVVKDTVVSDMANDDGEIIYTAEWQKNERKITVTWKDGYTDDPIKVEKVKKGITDEELEELYPADPARDGYMFNGWGDPETDEDGNITITAKWKKEAAKTYTVTYTDGVDGEEVFVDQVTSDLMKDDETPAFEEADKGTVADKSGNVTPIRDGYIFTGWSPEVVPTVTDNAVYTAQWKPQPTTMIVQWVKGYGSATSATIKHITIPLDTDYADEYPADPTREGYTFTGWSDPVASTTGNGQKVITITAQWEEAAPGPDEPKSEMMIVQWVRGYGSATSATIKHITIPLDTDYADEYPADKPTREGYTFTGWSDPEEGTASDGQKVITITAQWNINTIAELEDPTPPVPPTPDPETPTPTPNPIEPIITPIVEFLQSPIIPTVDIADDGTPLADEMTLEDEETPLSAFDHPFCWVHYYIILGIIITAIYGGGVIARRLGYTHKIKKYEDDVTGKEKKKGLETEPADAKAQVTI